jgi:hypothetical protein
VILRLPEDVHDEPNDFGIAIDPALRGRADLARAAALSRAEPGEGADAGRRDGVRRPDQRQADLTPRRGFAGPERIWRKFFPVESKMNRIASQTVHTAQDQVEVAHRRSYCAPSLVKGPMLTTATASFRTSGSL